MGWLDSIAGSLQFIGLLASAGVGLVYFFSARFRKRKQREWETESEPKIVAEWAEWLFAIFAFAALIAVAGVFMFGH